MAMVLAIMKWRPYLLGRQFINRTDQRSLKYLLEQRVVEGEHHKWLLKHLGYDFTIQYKPDKDNTVVDALSRLPAEMTLATLSVLFVMDFKELDDQVAQDPFLAHILAIIALDQAAYPHFTKVGNTLRYKGRVVLPAASPLIPHLLREFHCSPTREHSRVRRTYHRLSLEFYWRGIKRIVQDFVSSYDICQRHKYDSITPIELMQPLPVPHQIWDDVSMNFIEGLPKSKGCYNILVVIDRLSKYAHFISFPPLLNSLSGSSVCLRDHKTSWGASQYRVGSGQNIFEYFLV